jgi:DNA-binding transcriptional ArsR family regulator
MQPFEVLGDPVRRRILELLTAGEASSGVLGAAVQDEFGITQPAVSQHLRVLRDNGFATVRPEGTRRLYAIRADPLRDVDLWLEPFRTFWTQRRDALGTDVAHDSRGRRPPGTAADRSGPDTQG